MYIHTYIYQNTYYIDIHTIFMHIYIYIYIYERESLSSVCGRMRDATERVERGSLLLYILEEILALFFWTQERPLFFYCTRDGTCPFSRHGQILPLLGPGKIPPLLLELGEIPRPSSSSIREKARRPCPSSIRFCLCECARVPFAASIRYDSLVVCRVESSGNVAG